MGNSLHTIVHPFIETTQSFKSHPYVDSKSASFFCICLDPPINRDGSLPHHQCYIFGTYHVKDIVLNILILSQTLEGRYCYLYFAEEKLLRLGEVN